MTRPYYVQIPSGGQITLGEKWNSGQIDSVIKGLEKYGARPVTDLSRNLDKFPGLLYRLDKPITEDQIVSGHDAVVETQEKRSAAEASKSALAFDASTRDKRTKRRLAKLTEVSVEQIKPRNEPDTGKEVHFSLGVSENGDSKLRLPE